MSLQDRKAYESIQKIVIGQKVPLFVEQNDPESERSQDRQNPDKLNIWNEIGSSYVLSVERRFWVTWTDNKQEESDEWMFEEGKDNLVFKSEKSRRGEGQSRKYTKLEAKLGACLVSMIVKYAEYGHLASFEDVALLLPLSRPLAEVETDAVNPNGIAVNFRHLLTFDLPPPPSKYNIFATRTPQIVYLQLARMRVKSEALEFEVTRHNFEQTVYYLKQKARKAKEVDEHVPIDLIYKHNNIDGLYSKKDGLENRMRKHFKYVLPGISVETILFVPFDKGPQFVSREQSWQTNLIAIDEEVMNGSVYELDPKPVPDNSMSTREVALQSLRDEFVHLPPQMPVVTANMRVGDFRSGSAIGLNKKHPWASFSQQPIKRIKHSKRRQGEEVNEIYFFQREFNNYAFRNQRTRLVQAFVNYMNSEEKGETYVADVKRRVMDATQKGLLAPNFLSTKIAGHTDS